MKKVIALVLAVSLMISLFAISAFAAPRDFNNDSDHLSFDGIYINGKQITSGGDKTVAARNIDGTKGDITEVGLYGWFGTSEGSIDKMGYQIDDAEAVYGDFTSAAGDDVKAAGGEYRFVVKIDVTGLKDGKEHTIRAVAKLKDGKEIKLNRNEVTSNKDRDVMVKYTAPKAADPAPVDPKPADPTPENPPMGDAAVVLAIVAVAACALVVLKKKAF